MVATCYLLGVSTRRMDRLVQSLGITGLSKSQVSVMARDLDELVRDFRERPLDAGPYTFVAADALTMKDRRVTSKTTARGRRLNTQEVYWAPPFGVDARSGLGRRLQVASRLPSTT